MLPVSHLILLHGSFQGLPALPTLNVIKDVLFWAVKLWEPVPHSYLFGRTLPDLMIDKEVDESIKKDGPNALVAILEVLWQVVLDCMGGAQDPPWVLAVANRRIRHALSGKGHPHGDPTGKEQVRCFALHWCNLCA